MTQVINEYYPGLGKIPWVKLGEFPSRVERLENMGRAHGFPSYTSCGTTAATLSTEATRMSATLEPGEKALSEYMFGTSGLGRFLAVVWFRGERVLEGSFMLHEGPAVDVDGSEEEQKRYIYPLLFLAGFILLLGYNKLRKS